MDTAVVGFIGVLVGSGVTGLWQFGLAYRRDKRERRAASRLIAAELARMYQALWMPALVDAALTALSKLPGQTPAWDTHSDVLAAELSASDWMTVATAYEGLHSMETFRVIDFDDMPDQKSRDTVRTVVIRVAENVRTALAVLEGLERKSEARRLLDLPEPPGFGAADE